VSLLIIEYEENADLIACHSNATAYHGALGGGAGTVSDVRMDMDKV